MSKEHKDHSCCAVTDSASPAMDSVGNTDDDTQESVGILDEEIINCCTDDCDGASPEEQACGHCVLEEHPYPLKRNHSIITLQTTTIFRLPPGSQPSSRLHSFSVTDSEDESEIGGSKDSCQLSPVPRGLLDSVAVNKDTEVRRFNTYLAGRPSGLYPDRQASRSGARKRKPEVPIVPWTIPNSSRILSN